MTKRQTNRDDDRDQTIARLEALVGTLRTTVRTLTGFLDRDSLADARHDPMLREERERERLNALALLHLPDE